MFVSRRVQGLFVVDRISYEQDNYKVPLNYEFDRNIFSG